MLNWEKKYTKKQQICGKIFQKMGFTVSSRVDTMDVTCTLVWYKVVDSHYQYIDIQLRDQNNLDIPVLDTNIIMNFVIRKRKL